MEFKIYSSHDRLESLMQAFDTYNDRKPIEKDTTLLENHF